MALAPRADRPLFATTLTAPAGCFLAPKVRAFVTIERGGAAVAALRCAHAFQLSDRPRSRIRRTTFCGSDKPPRCRFRYRILSESLDNRVSSGHRQPGDRMDHQTPH